MSMTRVPNKFFWNKKDKRLISLSKDKCFESQTLWFMPSCMGSRKMSTHGLYGSLFRKHFAVFVAYSIVIIPTHRSPGSASINSSARRVPMKFSPIRRAPTRAGVPATQSASTVWHHYTEIQQLWRQRAMVLSSYGFRRLAICGSQLDSRVSHTRTKNFPHLFYIVSSAMLLSSSLR